MNAQKIMNSIILTVVVIAIAGALYPTLSGYVTNITTSQYCVAGTLGATCNGTATYGTLTNYSNTTLLTILTVLYWILISAGIVIYWVKSFKISA